MGGPRFQTKLRRHWPSSNDAQAMPLTPARISVISQIIYRSNCENLYVLRDGSVVEQQLASNEAFEDLLRAQSAGVAAKRVHEIEKHRERDRFTLARKLQARADSLTGGETRGYIAVEVGTQ